MKPCRRCSECVGCDHHWMECCEVVDRGLETGELIFDRVCKHCELLGTTCDECDGNGGYSVPAYVAAGEIIGADGVACENCGGAGVIASCLYAEESLP